jgi:hypothetical protein
MARALLAALLLLALASCAPAEDAWDIKVYPAPKAAGPITVDGVLDEPSWQEAPLVSGFTWYNKPELLQVQTSFRVLYDDRNLYFGVTCDEPLMNRVVPVAASRDSSLVFSGEAMEIFVDPEHDHAHYYQFAANSAGTVYDGRGNDLYWNAAVQAKTTLGDSSWTLEFAIPWRDLGVTPQAGKVVGFNVDRDRNVANAREWSNWAQQNANFHDPERFAHLVLSPTPEQLAALGMEFRKGGRRGPIVVYGKEGFAQSSYRALAQEALIRLDKSAKAFAALGADEANPAVKEEVQKRAARYVQQTTELRRQVALSSSLDAAAWVKLDLQIAALEAEMHSAVWDARLEGLLRSL